jgi:hypothetical protein
VTLAANPDTPSLYLVIKRVITRCREEAGLWGLERRDGGTDERVVVCSPVDVIVFVGAGGPCEGTTGVRQMIQAR